MYLNLFLSIKTLHTKIFLTLGTERVTGSYIYIYMCNYDNFDIFCKLIIKLLFDVVRKNYKEFLN